MRRKQQAGFTLAEILYVLAILAILCGLAVGAYLYIYRNTEKQHVAETMDAIRRAEILHNLQKNTFVNADDNSEIREILGLKNLNDRFLYKVVEATATEFMVIAYRLGDLMNGEMPFAAMMAAGSTPRSPA